MKLEVQDIVMNEKKMVLKNKLNNYYLEKLKFLMIFLIEN